MTTGSLRERLTEALRDDPDIWRRVNKGAACPHEIVERSGTECVVLSAWADAREADIQHAHAMAAKRADAALAAIEASGTHILMPVELSPEMVTEVCMATCSGMTPDGVREVHRELIAARPRDVARGEPDVEPGP